MSTNLLAAGLGAFAVSEATGTTNLTAIGSGGDDGEDDENPLSSIPGFAPPGPNGGPPAIDLSGLSLGGGGPSGTFQRVREIVQVPTGDSGSSGSDGSGGGPSWQDILGTVEEGSLYDPDRFGGGDGSDGSGSGSRGDFDIWDGIQAVNNFDAGDAGTRVGEGTGDFVENAATGATEGIGAGIGSVPFGLVNGAIDAGQAAGDKSRKWIADVTGAEGDGEGVNAGRPGAGITDVIDMVAKGEQGGTDPEDTKTPGEALKSIGGAAWDGLKSYEENRPRSLSERAADAVNAEVTDRMPDDAAEQFGSNDSGSDDSGGSSIDTSGAVRLGGSDSGGSSSGGSSSSGTTPSFRRSPSPDRVLGSEDPEDESDGTDYATDGRWGL